MNHRGLIISNIILFLWCSVSLALDPVEFIVQHNPDIQELRAYNRSIFSRLKVSLKGHGKYGQATTIETGWEREKTTLGGDIRVIAEMPIFSPQEKLQMRLKELELTRRIRREASGAVARYRGLKLWIEREGEIIKALEIELEWIKKRVETGVEPQKTYIERAIALRQRKQTLETKQTELQDALDTVLSFVPKSDRDALKQLLEQYGNK
ncbi:MAG: hypothetical protein DRG69_08840 [Deltaproteobacteria bacterium]|nr:MAG: hypothetical protein DRG69_08840 [Deltaproteobacteria bacterium]